MSDLELWQERVIAEKHELDIKLSKLSNFILSQNFVCIMPTQKALLIAQIKAMTEYSETLRDRISYFNTN